MELTFLRVGQGSKSHANDVSTSYSGNKLYLTFIKLPKEPEPLMATANVNSVRCHFLHEVSLLKGNCVINRKGFKTAHFIVRYILTWFAQTVVSEGFLNSFICPKTPSKFVIPATSKTMSLVGCALLSCVTMSSN